jgi:hypothetical protein
MRALAGFILGATILVGACYPDEINSVSDLASVTTLVDSQAPLRAARTYAMPDTVLHSLRRQGANVIGHDADPAILASIRGHFALLGWREVTDVQSERPDVVVLVGVFEDTNTGVAYTGWWGDWGYWPGWPAYGPDWAWGYPGGAVTFTYESGTLVLVMLDVRGGDTTLKRVPILWAAGIEGVITTTAVQGALAGIDQAFAQSPYLERP